MTTLFEECCLHWQAYKHLVFVTCVKNISTSYAGQLKNVITNIFTAYSAKNVQDEIKL